MRKRFHGIHHPHGSKYNKLCDYIIEYTRTHHSIRPPTLMQTIIDLLNLTLPKINLDQCLQLHTLFVKAKLTRIPSITLPLQKRAIAIFMSMHPFSNHQYQSYNRTSAMTTIIHLQRLMKLTPPYKSTHALHFHALAQAVNNCEPPPSPQESLRDALMTPLRFS